MPADGRGQAAGAAQGKRPGPGGQPRVPALPANGGAGLPARPGPDRGQGTLRRFVGTAGEGAVDGHRGGVEVQAAVAGGTLFPGGQVTAADAAGLPSP